MLVSYIRTPTSAPDAAVRAATAHTAAATPGVDDQGGNNRSHGETPVAPEPVIAHGPTPPGRMGDVADDSAGSRKLVWT